ncbi:MAG: hypothetical protein BGO31_07580 [Bacteroidetes bacterium 43-16]|nr:MAG: hypothetical protein BGO31_07580 [Bacteroidetes bacterium 43-16]
MPKPTLTPNDVTAEIDVLYTLSDSALLLEANAVANDFSSWLTNKFALTPEQVTYIATYPDKVNKFYGYLFAAAFLTRGPIIFPAIPANPAPRRIKETRANLFGNVSYNDNDNELEGTVEVNVEFALL